MTRVLQKRMIFQAGRYILAVMMKTLGGGYAVFILIVFVLLMRIPLLDIEPNGIPNVPSRTQSLYHGMQIKT